MDSQSSGLLHGQAAADTLVVRTCPSCGQTNDDDAFYYGARRCRKCVASATAEKRSRQALEDRERIQEQYRTRTSISGRRFRNLEKTAKQQAEALIPVTTRHRIGTAMIVAVPLGLFGGLMLSQESVAFLLLGFVVAGAAGWAGSKLQEPREKAVSDLSASILRGSVKQVDSQQQEYEQFYLTADWRELRRQVIARDGTVCRQCKLSIQVLDDVTVDHIKPRSKHPDLALVASNLQVLCRRCNSSKGAR